MKPEHESGSLDDPSETTIHPHARLPLRRRPSPLTACLLLSPRVKKTSPRLLSPGFCLIIHPMVCRGSALLHLPPTSTRLSFSAKPLLELWPRPPSPCASFQTLPVSIICQQQSLGGPWQPWLMMAIVTITDNHHDKDKRVSFQPGKAFKASAGLAPSLLLSSPGSNQTSVHILSPRSLQVT